MDNKNNYKFKKNDIVEIFLKTIWIKGKIIDWDDKYNLYKIYLEDNTCSFIPEKNIRFYKKIE
tara:strand:- start:51 stop:239 length:189 start_codon:yes stop_codon:yes gene_type:complete